MIVLKYDKNIELQEKIWEPLSHHTVVHNVTQARPGWSVAPANTQCRKQQYCFAACIAYLTAILSDSVKFDNVYHNAVNTKKTIQQ